MNFTAREARAILRREKTAHRLPIGDRTLVKRPGPRGLPRTGASAVVWREPFTPVAGHVYPVQVYDEANVPDVKGAIQIVAVDTTTLGDLTREDALAEGFKGFKGDVVALYKAAWVQRYGSNTDGLEQDELVARFDRYWAHKTVWLIELRVHEAQPLFIGRTQDYTHSPDATLDPEAGEVIDPVAIAAYAKRSYEEKMAAKAERRRAKAAVRFEVARREAEAKGHDTSKAVRHVERIAKALERASTREADADAA